MKYVYLGGNRGCSDDDDDRDCNQGNACVSRAGLVAIVSFEIVRSETSLILLYCLDIIITVIFIMILDSLM